MLYRFFSNIYMGFFQQKQHIWHLSRVLQRSICFINPSYDRFKNKQPNHHTFVNKITNVCKIAETLHLFLLLRFVKDRRDQRKFILVYFKLMWPMCMSCVCVCHVSLIYNSGFSNVSCNNNRNNSCNNFGHVIISSIIFSCMEFFFLMKYLNLQKY